MDLGLENVHVLITGASGGIGLATSRLFLKMGAHVTAHYNSKAAPLDPLWQEFGPGHVQTLQADLTSEDAVVKLFRDASESAFGTVQVVVVNHALFDERYVPVVDMSLEQWERTHKMNLTSPFLVAREYLRGLMEANEKQKEKAAIVLVGSVGGKFGAAGHADYASTKSAMMYGMCLSLKNEIVKIAPKGRVNAVNPGLTKTTMVEQYMNNPDALYKSNLATNPLKKIATPEDVANQIVLLSSSTVSGHVTGQNVMVDGGMEGQLLNMKEDLAGCGLGF